MSAEDSIRKFIIDDLKFAGDESELTDDYPLLEREVVDSMGIFRIVGFLEARMGIEVDDEDLLPDNFSSIGQIAQFVAAKKG